MSLSAGRRHRLTGYVARFDATWLRWRVVWRAEKLIVTEAGNGWTACMTCLPASLMSIVGRRSSTSRCLINPAFDQRIDDGRDFGLLESRKHPIGTQPVKLPLLQLSCCANHTTSVQPCSCRTAHAFASRRSARRGHHTAAPPQSTPARWISRGDVGCPDLSRSRHQWRLASIAVPTRLGVRIAKVIQNDALPATTRPWRTR